jgi:hypothetical protein
MSMSPESWSDYIKDHRGSHLHSLSNEDGGHVGRCFSPFKTRFEDPKANTTIFSFAVMTGGHN